MIIIKKNILSQKLCTGTSNTRKYCKRKLQFFHVFISKIKTYFFVSFVICLSLSYLTNCKINIIYTKIIEL